MSEMLAVLLVLAVLLTVVTLVGHAIWLVMAALIRAVFTSPSSYDGERSRREEASAVAEESEADLEATCRQLDRFRAEGHVTGDQYRRLRKLVSDRLAAVRQRIGDEHPDGQIEEQIEEQIVLAESVDQPDESADIAASRSVAKSPFATSAGEQSRSRTPAATDAAALLLDDASTTDGVAAAVASEEPPAAPRRPLSDLVAAFMAERNIRWGELISGILIVGSAVGLVISLRATLRDSVPYFAAMLFMVITLAIHGAGVYTLRKWNLKTTSRGILIISTLLVPLSFLVAIIFSSDRTSLRPMTDPIYIVAVVVSVAVFGLVAYSSARYLLVARRWSLWLVVMAPSVSQLAFNRLATPETSHFWGTLLTVPGLLGVVAGIWGQAESRPRSPESEGEGEPPVEDDGDAIDAWCEALLTVLGIGAFSLLIACGFLLSKTGASLDRVADYSLPISAFLGSVLAAGCAVHRAAGPRNSVLMTVGTALAVLSGVTLPIAVMLAWSHPATLVVTACLAAACCFLVANRFETPVLHAGTVALLSLAVLVGYHWSVGDLAMHPTGASDYVKSLAMGRTALLLTLLAGLFGAVSDGYRRRDRSVEFRCYAAGAAVLAALGLVVAGLVTLRGLPDAALVSYLFAFHALALTVVTFAVRQPWAAWGAVGMLLVAIMHALLWDPVARGLLISVSLMPAQPWLTGMLLFGSMTSVLGIAGASCDRIFSANSTDDMTSSDIHTPFALATLVGAVVTTPMALWFPLDGCLAHAAYLFVLAFWFLVVSYLLTPRWSFLAFQSATACGFSFLVAAVHGWITSDVALASVATWPVTPGHLHWQVGSLAVWCAVWPIVRARAGENSLWRGEPTPNHPRADAIVLGLLFCAVLSLAAISCLPGLDLQFGSEVTGGFSEAWKTRTYGLGAWLSLGIVGLSLALRVATDDARRRIVVEYGCTLLLFSVICLIAAGLQSRVPVGWSLRWLFSGGALVAALAALLVGRARWWRSSAETRNMSGGDTPGDEVFGRLPPDARDLLPIVATLVTVLLTACALERAWGHTWPATWPGYTAHARTLSFGYAVPLIMLAIAMLSLAVTKRRTHEMFFFGAFVVGAVDVAYLLFRSRSLPPLRIEHLADLLIWNTLALGAVGLVWLAVNRFMDRSIAPARTGRRDVVTPLLLVLILESLFVLWVAGRLLVDPEGIAIVTRLGIWYAHVGHAMAIGAWFWYVRRRWRKHLIPLVIGAGTLTVAAAAAGCARAWPGRPWWAFHVLSGGLPLMAAASLAGAWKLGRRSVRRTVHRYRWMTTWLLLASLTFSIRAGWGDPWFPYGSIGVTLLVAACFAALALTVALPGFEYLSLATLALAATQFWFGVWPSSSRAPVELCQLNLLAVGAGVTAWLIVRIYLRRRGHSGEGVAGEGLPGEGVAGEGRSVLPAVPACVPAATIGLIGATWVLSALCLCADVLSRNPAGLAGGPLGWILLLQLGSILLVSAWDDGARHLLACVHAWLLTAVTVTLDALRLDDVSCMFGVGVGLAANVLLWGYLWRNCDLWIRAGGLLGVNDVRQGWLRCWKWLPVVNLLAAVPVLLIALALVLEYGQRQLRYLSGFTPLAVALGLALLAHERWRATMQRMAWTLAGVGLVLLGWADMEPDWTIAGPLHRAVRMLVVVSAVALLYSAAVPRWLAEDWRARAREVATGLAVAAAIILLSVVTTEAGLFLQGTPSPLSLPEIVVLTLALLGLIATLLRSALAPPGERRPGLSDSQRVGCVWAAQVVAALTFGHLYFSFPELFRGLFVPYWPFIVMAIAMAGVGVSELFHRRGVAVLAEPLRQTGTFLPLLPALTWWIGGADYAASYSMLLFLAGLVYVMLSFLRGSTVSALAAAAAGNAALWALLDEQGVSLLAHPQFWMIPPALSVLVAAHVNRRHLSDAQLSSIRYLALLVVYVSSTGEIFLTGIGQALWPPMLLALLAVLGVFAGILLHIRPFLYLGASFVVLAVVSMVWHASQAIDHVWPWWVFGIGLGICILVLFAVFEKRRDDIARIVDEVRHW